LSTDHSDPGKKCDAAVRIAMASARWHRACVTLAPDVAAILPDGLGIYLRAFEEMGL